MKSYPDTTLKVFWVILLLLSIVFGLKAENKSEVMAKILYPEAHSSPVIEILTEECELIEENTKLEEWMFNFNFKQDQNQRQIEGWMLDDEFWKIEKEFLWNENPDEKQKEIESWMTDFKVENLY